MMVVLSSDGIRPTLNVQMWTMEKLFIVTAIDRYHWCHEEDDPSPSTMEHQIIIASMILYVYLSEIYKEKRTINVRTLY